MAGSSVHMGCCVLCLHRLLCFRAVPGRRSLGHGARLPRQEPARGPGGGAAGAQDNPHGSAQAQAAGTASGDTARILTAFC